MLKTIDDMINKKNEIYNIIQSWGFNLDPNKLPRLHKDLYNFGDNAGILILVETNDKNLWLAKHLRARMNYLELELMETFHCKVSICLLNNVNEMFQEKINTNAVSLLENDQKILSHFGKAYKVRTVGQAELNALRNDLLIEDVLDQTKKFKEMKSEIQNAIKSQSASQQLFEQTHLGGVEYLVEMIQKDQIAKKFIEKDPSILSEVEKHFTQAHSGKKNSNIKVK